MPIPFSILDLSQISEGFTVSDALANSARMAQTAEAHGYSRYWLAEHHGMPGIASAATSIVIAHVGQATKSIRIGSGGIMLPNHSPLVIAEQFGTLEALFPGRVDLGLGRAPGTDMATARALRRNMDAGVDSFPHHFVRHMLGWPTIALFANTKPCNSDARESADYRALVGALPCNPCGADQECPMIGREDCDNFAQPHQVVAAILEMARAVYGATEIS